MTLEDINNRITFLTGADVLNYTYKDRILNINKWYNVVNSTILQSQDESGFDDSNNTTFPWPSLDLVANRQDYSLPAKCLQVKALQVSYDGSNFAKAVPIEGGESSEPLRNVPFSVENPMYDIEAGAILLYPTPANDVVDGLKVWISRSVIPFVYTDESDNELLTGTSTPGFDDIFHDILAMGASYEWKSTKLNDKSGYQEIQLMLADLKRHYGTKQKDRRYQFSSNIVNCN